MRSQHCPAGITEPNSAECDILYWLPPSRLSWYRSRASALPLNTNEVRQAYRGKLTSVLCGWRCSSCPIRQRAIRIKVQTPSAGIKVPLLADVQFSEPASGHLFSADTCPTLPVARLHVHVAAANAGHSTYRPWIITPPMDGASNGFVKFASGKNSSGPPIEPSFWMPSNMCGWPP